MNFDDFEKFECPENINLLCENNFWINFDYVIYM